MDNKKNAAFILAMLSVMGTTEASALNISSTLGSGGYDLIPITVATEGVVDMSFTVGGFTYASFSLFDATGQHLITNEQTSTYIVPQITQILAPGTYSLLVSVCCYASSHILYQGGYSTYTDGFNYGFYYYDSNATIAGMGASLALTNAHWAGSPYTMTITGAVPEPQTYALMLAGLGLVGAMARRRKLTKT